MPKTGKLYAEYFIVINVNNNTRSTYIIYPGNYSSIKKQVGNKNRLFYRDSLKIKFDPILGHVNINNRNLLGYFFDGSIFINDSYTGEINIDEFIECITLKN